MESNESMLISVCIVHLRTNLCYTVYSVHSLKRPGEDANNTSEDSVHTISQLKQSRSFEERES